MATTLIIPGLDNSGPGHWQTWLEARIPHAVRVNQRDWRDADLPRWSQAVRRELAAVPGRVWIVAHSFGALAAVQAAWDYRERIAGAMFVAPADPDKFGVAGLLPDRPLGFQSLVIASTNDPWMEIGKARHWAAAWGSILIDLGAQGHINERSGHGPWPDGLYIFSDLRKSLRRQSARSWAAARRPHGPTAGVWGNARPNSAAALRADALDL